MSTESAEPVAQRAGLVGGATLASRVLGLLRDTVLANVFARQITDAFFLAFMLPNLLRRLVGEGSLTPAFVPVFTGWLRRSREEARRAFNATWTLAAVVGLGLVLAGVALADPLVGVFAPGFSDSPGKHDLTVALLRLCFPYILFMILLAVAMGALNAVGHFLMPAIAPVLLNLALIAAAFVGAAWLGVPVMALGWGVLIAGAAQAALQIRPLRRLGLGPRLLWEPRHPALLRLGRLMFPAALGASVFQLNLLVNRFLASFQGDGAVSYLYYADRLLELPLGLFVFALGTASLPSFSRLAKQGDRDGLRSAFSTTLSLSLALAVPSAVGLIALREEIFTALFRWNPQVFTQTAVEACARALWLYSLGLVPIALSRLFVNLCVAHEDTRTGAQAAGVSLAVNLIGSLALIGPLPRGSLPGWFVELQHGWVVADLGFAGLALASSLAALAHALFVIARTRVLHGALVSRPDLAGGMRVALAAAVMGGAVAGLAHALPVGEEASPRALAVLALLVASGASVYLLTLLALRGPEPARLLLLLRRERVREPVRDDSWRE